MFAILGDIPFEVTASPQQLIAARRYHYAEHEVIEGRPQLQWISDGLETLRLQLLLHRSIGDPVLSLALLQEAGSTHAGMPLVFGNGDFRGYFVVAEIETISRQLNGAGDPVAIEARVVLREYVSDADPTALFPSFSPIGVAAALGAAGVTSPAEAGVSALLAFAPMPGPATPNLQPGDVPLDAVVRKARL